MGEFVHRPVNHIITGNLDIISNDKLKELFSKGPKYRESKSFSWRQNFKIIMDAVEAHAKKWVRRESAEPDALSEWVKSIRSLVKRKIHLQSKNTKTKHKPTLGDASVLKCLNKLHEQFVVVPADKAPNNIIFVCKAYYIQCLIGELKLDTNHTKSIGSTTYKRVSFSNNEIISNHASFMTYHGINFIDEDHELPSLIQGRTLYIRKNATAYTFYL